MENETGVSKQAQSPEPAPAAENLSAGGTPGAAPASSAAADSETPVSYAQAQLRTEIANYLFANPPTIGLHQMEQLQDSAARIANETVQQAMTAYDLEVNKKIENVKADIIALLNPPAHVGPVVSRSAIAGPTAKLTAPVVTELDIGDPVKVWGDPEHKTFRLGEIDAVHDAGHAYDVLLDDGTVTKIGADGLELETRK